MSSNEKWLEGGFALNDDQIETPAAKEIRLSDYTDMSPLGNWIPEIPTFNSSATEQDKSGILIIFYISNCAILLKMFLLFT